MNQNSAKSATTKSSGMMQCRSSALISRGRRRHLNFLFGNAIGPRTEYNEREAVGGQGEFIMHVDHKTGTVRWLERVAVGCIAWLDFLFNIAKISVPNKPLIHEKNEDYRKLD
jgi:hypothetical protein